MSNARRLVSMLAASAVAGGTLLVSATPAHAICYADLVGAGYGASDSCTDYANGVYVQVGRGLAHVDIYCNGAHWYSRDQVAGTGVLYSLAANGCSARVVLTARYTAGDTDALAYMD